MINGEEGSAQQAIQLVSAKTNEAEQHAIDAGNKAQTAQLSASQTTAHLSKAEQLVGSIDQYKAVAQTEIHFRPGQTVLSKKAKDALDEMAAPLKDQPNYIIEVRGFAAGSGQAAIATSKSMANAVVRYLMLNHKIPGYRIYMVGMGTRRWRPKMGPRPSTPVVAGRNQCTEERSAQLSATLMAVVRRGEPIMTALLVCWDAPWPTKSATC